MSSIFNSKSSKVCYNLCRRQYNNNSKIKVKNQRRVRKMRPTLLYPPSEQKYKIHFTNTTLHCVILGFHLKGAETKHQ